VAEAQPQADPPARRRSRPLLTAAITVGLCVVVFGGGFVYMTRTHTVVYTAQIDGCDGAVMYMDNKGQERRTTFHSSWQSGEILIDHGDTALVSVNRARGCEKPVFCGLREDGEMVAEGGGAVGAVCSASTAR
jgi:hypothetical protein